MVLLSIKTQKKDLYFNIQKFDVYGRTSKTIPGTRVNFFFITIPQNSFYCTFTQEFYNNVFFHPMFCHTWDTRVKTFFFHIYLRIFLQIFISVVLLLNLYNLIP